MEKEKKLEDIAKEIEEKKRLPKEEVNNINKRVFSNIMIAVLVMLYFCFISLGYVNIERPVFIVDLKVFSISLLVLAIILFEKSYKKEDGKLCIYGIETLVLAIVTLLGIAVSTLVRDVFLLIVPIISYTFAIYYVSKAILIYNKMKREYIRSLSDIKEIVKKEEPTKKKETSKKSDKKPDKKPVKKENLDKNTVKEITTKGKTNTKKEVKKTTKTTKTSVSKDSENKKEKVSTKTTSKKPTAKSTPSKTEIKKTEVKKKDSIDKNSNNKK